MSKLSKDELIAKVNDKLGENSELAVELMEDISDSIDNDLSMYETKLAESEGKYNELLQKYKDRFLEPEKVKDLPEEPEEMKEVQYIDIREI